MRRYGLFAGLGMALVLVMMQFMPVQAEWDDFRAILGQLFGSGGTDTKVAVFNGTQALKAGTITDSGTALTLGDGSDTVEIASSDWDIGTTGNASNLGTIGCGGLITNTIDGNNTATEFLQIVNSNQPTSGQTGDTATIAFDLVGTTNNGGLYAQHEAARIEAYKVTDWFDNGGAEADYDSGLAFYVANGGAETQGATLDHTGTFDAVAITASGNPVLTAEADTLADVTGRGATSAQSLTLTGATPLTLGEDKAGGNANTAGYLKLFSAGDNAYYSTFTAGTQTANIAYTLPTADLASGVLQSNGSGVLSWVTTLSGFNTLSATNAIGTTLVRGGYIYANSNSAFDGAANTVQIDSDEFVFEGAADTNELLVKYPTISVAADLTTYLAPIKAPTAGTGIDVSGLFLGMASEVYHFTHDDFSVAATTKDLVIATLPARALLAYALLVVTEQGAFADTITISLGSAAANYDQIIADCDGKAAGNTVYGDADLERSTDLPDADVYGAKLYSWTATQAITAHIDGNLTNLSGATAGEYDVVLFWQVPPTRGE